MDGGGEGQRASASSGGGAGSTAAATAATEGGERTEALDATANAEAEGQPVLEQSVSDEKYLARAMMVREAELRAEHQQQARAMMIDLARTVEELNSQNKELQASLRAEVQHSNDLEAKVARLQTEVVNVKFQDECRESDRLYERGLQTNGMVFGMLLEASRDIWQPELFPRPRPQKAQGEPDGSPQAARAKRFAPRLLVPSRLDKLKREEAFQTICSGGSNAADRITFTLIVRMWRQEVIRAAKRRVVAEVEEQQRSLLEDRERLIGDEVEKRVGEFRKAVSDLEYQVDMLTEEKKAHEQRIQELLEQLDQQLLQNKEKEQKSLEELRALQAEIKALKMQLEDANRKRSSMNSQYEETERELRRELAIREAEIRKLKEIISNLECDLAQALVLARHLKDTAMKAKRDAAMSVSPKKFAMLIADLEEMKDRLTRLGKEYGKERTIGEALKGELERRQRQLELERQFLPFLHVSRGPLGQKAPAPHAATTGAAGRKSKSPDASWEVPISPGEGGSPNPKLKGSQSAGALATAKSAP
mmetsp:Transcript_32104/g.73413  ORF Transcript_32104/g.73413 Transcript_32104/m.73413 type:complete len:535 (+) Transcript_32104:105-1709(+)